MLNASGSLFDNPYLFQGRRFDPESGLYYYRARYYNPTTGRFLSFDALGYEAGKVNAAVTAKEQRNVGGAASIQRTLMAQSRMRGSLSLLGESMASAPLFDNARKYGHATYSGLGISQNSRIDASSAGIYMPMSSVSGMMPQGSIGSMNLYEVTLSAPIALTDPYGLDCGFWSDVGDFIDRNLVPMLRVAGGVLQVVAGVAMLIPPLTVVGVLVGPALIAHGLVDVAIGYTAIKYNEEHGTSGGWSETGGKDKAGALLAWDIAGLFLAAPSAVSGVTTLFTKGASALSKAGAVISTASTGSTAISSGLSVGDYRSAVFRKSARDTYYQSAPGSPIREGKPPR